MSTVLVACFQLLILAWDRATSVLRNINTYTLGVGNPVLLWDSVVNRSEFHQTLNKR
jgi:hypothetical protein